MIVVNLSTEGDIANGTQGTITAIILDPREQRSEPNEEGAIRLMYPPAMILFEPDGGSQIPYYHQLLWMEGSSML